MSYIHPFPARMAPELALDQIAKLNVGSVVLDPMMGSGTVIREAAAHGCNAIGFDMDPLAVLMTNVATSRFKLDRLLTLAEEVCDIAQCIDGRSLRLDWIDDDPETKAFTEFWFAPPQRLALRKLAFVFDTDMELKARRSERSALMLAMSRIIVTKEQRASLARDTSRSRPHRVADENDFDVYSEFLRSVKRLKNLLDSDPLKGSAKVRIGDARNMKSVATGSVDAVITSPPYLNAIDYLRGHKMSLVWMGYSVSDIRNIRSNSVGAERRPDKNISEDALSHICAELGDVEELPTRYQSLVKRYAIDLSDLLSEIARVMKPKGHATFVVGNSCLRGVFIQNSGGVAKAAELNRFRLVKEVERELPETSRSLPMMMGTENALAKRMRTESVMTFERLAS